MIVNIVLVSYIDDAYFEDIDIIQDNQVTEFMKIGSLHSYFNLDCWDFGVV